MSELLALLSGRRVAVLTGAGCSTESGIPDYRGPGTRERARNPVQFREFTKDRAARRRYWARSAAGWPRIARARPNRAHDAIAALEARGLLTGVITQNVDRLHHKAGSRDVIELHGALAEVVCLECGVRESREHLQRRIALLNPGLSLDGAEVAPDGDADLASPVERFVPPDCAMCGGVLKPAVVFFGESVARDVVDAAYDKVERADALLVVGSSLTVFSGYRFVLRARDRKIPVAIVNLGPTRGDAIAAVRVDAACGDVLPEIARRL